MKPDYMKYDGRTKEPPYQTECDKRLETIEKGIIKLESRITALENKPAQYVPPPVYGPLSNNTPIKTQEEFTKEEFEKLREDYQKILDSRDK